MTAKFNFYEIAKVRSLSRLKKFNGMECIIIGKAQDEESKLWSYAIDVGDKASSAFEYELEKTGKFANSDDFKPVDTVCVRVMPDGSGEIVEDEEE
ncbi:MAG: Immunity protein 31 [Francisellaceae bacterium]|nr:Immunity protein 31 [Francisellaceae bacterium]